MPDDETPGEEPSVAEQLGLTVKQKKIWAVVLGDNHVSLDDLPYKTISGIAKRNGIVWYAASAIAPYIDDEFALELIAAAAEKLGIEPPAPPEAYGAFIKWIATMFAQLADDLPEEHENGVPLTAAPTTG